MGVDGANKSAKSTEVMLRSFALYSYIALISKVCFSLFIYSKSIIIIVLMDKTIKIARLIYQY